MAQRKKKEITKETPVRWDKIQNVTGKVVRHSLDDKDKFKEMSDLITKNKAKRLYFSIDGDKFYYYYELL